MRLAILIVAGLAWLASAPGEACDELELEPVPEASAGLRGGCVPLAVCEPISGHDPVFERWPSDSSVVAYPNPVSGDGGCFGVASLPAPDGVNDDERFTLLANQGGFHRATATDASMGTNWTPTDPIAVFPAGQGWTDKIKCPDVRHHSDGRLYLHFWSWGPDITNGIGRAWSSDNGETWTLDPADKPVLQGSEGTMTPCAIEYPATYGTRQFSYLMAYTQGGLANGEIGVAYSRNGVKWFKNANNPVVNKGTCDANGTEWDSQAVISPDLIADPCDPATLHMFYTGMPQREQGIGRCARVGHAYSTDGGETWDENDAMNPVLDLAADPSDWDYSETSFYTTSTVSSDDGTEVYIYYTSGNGEVGLAHAPWSAFPRGVPCSAAQQAGLEELLDEVGGERAGASVGKSAFDLSLSPNPVRGGAAVVSFRLPETAHTSVRVYDVSGRLVAEVLHRSLSAGPHEIPIDGGRLSAGVYSVVVTAGEQRAATRLIWVN